MNSVTPKQRYTCDWWLGSRRKCNRYGSIEARDQYGAPFRFCAHHWPLAQRGQLGAYGALTRWAAS